MGLCHTKNCKIKYNFWNRFKVSYELQIETIGSMCHKREPRLQEIESI